MPSQKRGRVYDCRRFHAIGDRRAMTWHVMKCHVEITQVPYACLLCNYRNQKKSGLLSHLWSATHMARQQVSPTQHAASMPQQPYEVTMVSETNSKGEDLLVWRQSKSDRFWMAQQGIALPLESASSESSSESGEEQSDGLSTPEPYSLLGVDSDTPQEMEKGRPDLVHGAAETPVVEMEGMELDQLVPMEINEAMRLQFDTDVLTFYIKNDKGVFEISFVKNSE